MNAYADRGPSDGDLYDAAYYDALAAGGAPVDLGGEESDGTQ